MIRPSADALTKAYFEHQVRRTAASLGKIIELELANSGRVVPEAQDLGICDGRRLEATVLFLDICGFSSRRSSTLEEQRILLRVLSLFFTEMISIVEDYGGTVEKNTGDGLMAYFAKDGTGGCEHRAIASALTMFAAADSLINPILEQSVVPRIDFRVCLDHGLVTIAKIGAPRRFNGIVAIGATANIACKMLRFAEPNTILLGTAALLGLPAPWLKSHVHLKTAQTGWSWGSQDQPYAFWEFTGRWPKPL